MPDCTKSHAARIFQLISILLLPLSAAGIALEVTNASGFIVQGEALRLEPDSLTISLGTQTEGYEVVIPLETIQSVYFSELGSMMADPSRFLYLAPLFKYADAPTICSLLETGKQLAEQQRWMDCYTWMEALGEIPMDPSDTRVRDLTRAQAQSAMGMQEALGRQLQLLNKQIAPIEAPLDLCILNARFHLAEGHFKEARYWATLPELRIPIRESPELVRIQQSMASLAGHNQNAL